MPEMGASSQEVDYQTSSRVNGWSLPPHPFQFIAWGFLVYFALFYYLVTVPHLLTEWQPTGYILQSIIFVAHVIIHIVTCTINPADEGVRTKHAQGNRHVPHLDRTQHKHAIENQHCFLCEVDVGIRSKHCSACNKCVQDFDHHCKWLNNCVGGRNYRLFIATLATAIAASLLLFILSVLQFTAYFTDRYAGNLLQPYREMLEDSPPVSSQLQVQSALESTSAKASPGTSSSAALEFVTALANQLLVSSTQSPDVSTFYEAALPGVAVFRLFYHPVPDPAWLALVALTALLSLVAVGLLVHLLGFHVYLMCKGLSTYDYIVLEREKAEAAARQKDLEAAGDPKAKKCNQVAPHADEPPESERPTVRTRELQTCGTFREQEYSSVETDRERERQYECASPPSAPSPPPPLPEKEDLAVIHQSSVESTPVKTIQGTTDSKRKQRRKPRINSRNEHAGRLPHMNGHLAHTDDTDELSAVIQSLAAEIQHSTHSMGAGLNQDFEINRHPSHQQHKHRIRTPGEDYMHEQSPALVENNTQESDHGPSQDSQVEYNAELRIDIDCNTDATDSGLNPVNSGVDHANPYVNQGFDPCDSEGSSTLSYKQMNFPNVHADSGYSESGNDGSVHCTSRPADVERLALPDSSDSEDGYSRLNNRIQGGPGVYSPRSYVAHHSPRGLNMLPPLHQSQGALDSDSGESLHEIPLSQTQHGSTRRVSPRRLPAMRGLSKHSSHRKRSKRRHRRSGSPHASMCEKDLATILALSQSPLGVHQPPPLSYGTQDPMLSNHNSAVPPLNLASLAGDSDEDSRTAHKHREVVAQL